MCRRDKKKEEGPLDFNWDPSVVMVKMVGMVDGGDD